MSDKEVTREEKYDEYKEVMITIRHYSNLRFAILTVFLTLMLLLFKFVLNLNSNEIDISLTLIQPIICSFGVVLTIIFLYLERVLNSYMVAYEEFAKQIREISHLNYRYQRHAPVALIFLYSMVIFLWFYLLLSSLPIDFSIRFLISSLVTMIITVLAWTVQSYPSSFAVKSKQRLKTTLMPWMWWKIGLNLIKKIINFCRKE